MESDVQLIYRVLSGDDEAFTTLVRKHQKGVHALAWRRIGDFHFAEEIAQDTFLRAYKGLPKLKNPSQFSGWLYVITNRLCNSWLEKNKSIIKSVEDVPVVEIQRMSYERYVLDEQEKEAKMVRQKLVRQLLAKLPESERTVMTLYYLGEMTTKEISKFLGVSVNTITSRLQRARERLQHKEELLLQEILGGVQLSNTLTEDIARKVADVKLTPPANWKPFIPWTALGAAVVLVVLLLSASDQYLLRFQKPYSFEAESERTVEIIDAPVVLKSEAKPAVRNQAGRAAATDRNGDDGVQVSTSVLAANAEDEWVRLSESRWLPTSGPGSGSVFDVFATSGGTVYAFSQAGTYKLVANATAWVPVAVDVPTETLRVPMAEHDGVLYLLSKDTVFTSTDDGETWKAFCTGPEGNAVGFVIMNKVKKAGITMYIALENNGIFRSTDTGEQWVRLSNGLMGKTISRMAAIEDTVFVGTDSGLYRLNAGVWERLLVDVPGSIYALVVSEDNLYVSTGPDFRTLQQIESKPGRMAQAIYNNNSSLSRAFHSADFGASWTEITPTGGSYPIIAPFGISVLVAGKTILAQGFTQFRSRDGGQTWSNLGFETDSLIQNAFLSVAVNENTFYKTGIFGIHRTTDGGESWHLFMDGMVGTGVLNLVGINNRLYVHTQEGIAQSTDSGESWSEVKPKSIKDGDSRLNFSAGSRLTIAGNILYVISPEKDDLSVFRSSADGNGLIPVQGVPVFDVDVSFTNNEEVAQIHVSDGPEKVDDLYASFPKRHERIGAFVVNAKTFYTEYKRRLFKWQPGDLNWEDTGVVDTGEPPDGDLKCGFRLAVSGETVYVGKRDGRLLQSLDAGSSWKDITLNLPRRFTCFKEIVFAGSTVYITTDAGVLASQTGMHWRVIADDVAIDRFAVDGSTVYGAGDKGIYRLDVHDKWEQISPVVPGKVLSLVVNHDRLYVATEQRGIFHISLEENKYLVNH